MKREMTVKNYFQRATNAEFQVTRELQQGCEIIQIHDHFYLRKEGAALRILPRILLKGLIKLGVVDSTTYLITEFGKQCVPSNK